MKQIIPDALAALAVALITAGVAMWSVPAAFIVAGVGVAAAALYLARLEPA